MRIGGMRALRMRTKIQLFSLPFIGGYLAFYILPFFYSIYYSLIDNVFSAKFVGIANYLAVINNPYYQLALRNTLFFILINVPILFLLSLLTSMLLNSFKKYSLSIRKVFIIPLVLPSASVIPIILRYFVDYNSPIQQLLYKLGASQLIAVHLPVTFLFVWKNTGFHIILIVAALLMIPVEIYEAAEVDGARGFKRLISITFPLILPTLSFSFLMSIVQALRIFREAYLLYGPYPDTTLYMVQHYMNNHFYKLNYPNLAVGGIVFAVAICLLLGIFYFFKKRIGENE